MTETQQILNVFDTSFESTKLYKQRMEAMEKETALTARVGMLLQRDYAMISNYCKDDVYLKGNWSRDSAVNLIIYMCFNLRIGTAATWTAIRLFDEFYCKPLDAVWFTHWKTVAAVVIDIAGKVAPLDEGNINICEQRNHLVYIYNLMCVGGSMLPEYNSWKILFDDIQRRVLRALNFDVLIATPNEYISECTTWIDIYNAARIQPTILKEKPVLTNVPGKEVMTARMIFYLCFAMAYHPRSINFSTVEIVGFASYVATEPERKTPQPVPISTPAIICLWERIQPERFHGLNEMLYESIKFLATQRPNNILDNFYPEESKEWKAVLAKKTAALP